METSYHDIIRRHCQPLEPISTGVEPQIVTLDGIRAVVFDIYGTMLISASGDIGFASPASSAKAMADALSAVGIPEFADPIRAVDCLRATITAHHQRLRNEGADYPEVDILQVWDDVLHALGAQGTPTIPLSEVDRHQLAIEYEVRINPVWPMPHLRSCLVTLSDHGLALGIISNAQFFTVELFPALLDESLESLGFDPELQVYSYRHGQAKPGEFLFHLAAKTFASRGIRQDEILYMGNDMVNDILPASRIGFHTALFAGDARSLRRRENDSRVAEVSPDVVFTDLMQWTQCITRATS